MKEFYVGQKVKIFGTQDGRKFNGEQGVVCLLSMEINGYDVAVDFGTPARRLHSCMTHTRFRLPGETGFFFQARVVNIQPVVEDTFEEDGEE